MEAILKSAFASAQDPAAGKVRTQVPSLARTKGRVLPGKDPSRRSRLPRAALVLRLPTGRLTGKPGSEPLLDRPPSF